MTPEPEADQYMADARSSAPGGIATDRPATPRPFRLGALFLAVAMLVFGNGLNGTVLGVRGVMEGMTSEVIGAIMSAYFLGFVAGAWLAPRLIARVGHIRTFSALCSIGSALAIAYAMRVDPWAWGAFRLVYGACYAGLIVVVESWLNAASGSAHRGRVLAVYNIVLMSAWAASQPVLALAETGSFFLFAVTCILLSLALVPVALTRSRSPAQEPLAAASMRTLFAVSPLAFAGTLLSGVSMGAFWGMGPVFMARLGFGDLGIALFMASAMAGALVLSWPLGRLSDRFDRRLVIAAAAGCAGAASAVLALAEGMPNSVFFSSTFVFGGFALPLYSLCVANANDHVAERDLVPVASRLVLVYGLGAIAGPILASQIMIRTAPQGLFLLEAGVLGGLAVLGVLRLRHRTAPPPAAKTPCVIIPRTTQVALKLHPASPPAEPPRSSNAG